MTAFNKLIKNYLRNFLYFYIQLRYRMFIMILLGILVGIMDGFGLAMFMPLLEMVNQTEQSAGSSLGNLSFLVEGIKNVGLELTLITVLVIMIFFFTVKGIVKYFSNTYNALLRRLFIDNLRNKILNDFNEIRYKYFVTSDVGRIQNTMSVEVERASGAFYNYANAIQQGLMVLVYVGFAFYVDTRFALLVSIGGGVTNILYKSIYKKTKGASVAFTNDSHLYQGQIIQYVANFKYLKATALLDLYSNRLRASIHAIENSRFKIGKLSALLESSREPILISVVAVVIIIQTQILGASLGPILISLLFFYRALSSLLNLQNSYNRFLEQYGSLENLIDFQQEIKVEKELKGNQTVDGLKSTIVLQDISLYYNSVTVLDRINLKISKNETVAFVGESGSGKTTLVNVLAGLMPVDSGLMHIDGVNRNEIDLATYQRKLGYITQDPVIFSDTIFNNVTLWDEPNINSLGRYDEAISKASIKNYIDEQPDQSKTILGNDGINLSGGQKQRISIARELYKNIDVLIMDEATSALDTETEKEIQESIDALKGKYTILLVAHRLSTIRNADRIVVMNKGRIEQIGTYEELIHSSTLFGKMIQLQGL
ncbi:ABC transporter ATP-binding protein [Flavobacterium lacus]|uniref:ATP-binding cassette, subfamily B, MsbA n=1 Tax=Flavobacterium lacus TaxID=1353778 RepID=A0A328WLY7_9FLAO|nr:ABC transporter ATP-binding protein [Flavobacterium lacus]RAR47241.1 ATP-binding cassette, subfamily B, MsbA [Flavobacterium lacus]